MSPDRHLVQAWDPLVGKRLRSYQGPGDTAVAVAVSPDGMIIAAAKARSLLEKAPGYVLIWDAKSGELLSKVDCGQSILGGLAFSPDGKFLAYSTDNIVRFFAIK
jgi:WD40 repeat protein